MSDALVWYVVLQLAALAVWPLVGRALAPLDDRGWAASKAVGLLSVAWLVWLVCMLAPVPFTRATLAIGVLGLGGLAWGWADKQGSTVALLAWVRSRRGLLLAWEAIFLGAFAAFGVLRAHEPAIAFTEKPMDMAFLNGFIAAQRLPTQDTWLAGYGVPYYHFGYFVLAAAAKLSGTAPGVAYNLGAATVPALALVGLAALAWNLARAAGVRPGWAAIGAGLTSLLVLLAGNLSTFFELLVARGLLSPDAGTALGIKHFAEGVTPGVWPPADGFWWFHASRVIPNIQPDGIDEFPFFSALLSDLHPHFVALPFEVLVLAIGVTHVVSRGRTLRSVWSQALACLGLGGLLVINTWDIAPFWSLYVGLAVVGAVGARGESRAAAGGENPPSPSPTESRSRWVSDWALAFIAPIVGTALFLPYFVGYGGPPLGLGIVGERTPLSSLLVLFGGPLVLLAGLGLFMRWCVGDRRGWLLSAAGVGVGLILAGLGQPTLGLLLALVLLVVPWPRVLDSLPPAAVATVAIGAFAAAMLLGVELVYLDDVFHSRMNTVFKFHENAWLLIGLAAGVGLALVGHFTRRVRWLLAACAALVLAAGLVYPLSAIATRLDERPPYGLTLDGLAFLNPDERAAVRWLADQNAASPDGRVVIAEAVGNEYSSAARMATYSGAATVLGWSGHELQWRGPIRELGRREADLASVYRDIPEDAIPPILARYGVRFVVVGDLERERYGPGVETRFEGVLPVAFRAGSVTIYRAA